MPTSELLRLNRVKIGGLFDMYEHSIDLNLEDRVTLLHGPNGVGKTSVLKATNALLRGNLAYFSTIPFKCTSLRFDGGAKLEIAKCDTSNASGQTYRIHLFAGDQDNSKLLDLRQVSAASAIAKRLSFLEPLGEANEAWMDLRTEEVLAGFEIVERYGGLVEEPGLDCASVPWLQAFLQNSNAYLIEAQRLEKSQVAIRESRYSRTGVSRRSSVAECASDFKRRMGETMANYGRQAQSLDQSFPQRLMSASDAFDGDQLKQKMEKLLHKTDEFRRIGILEKEQAPATFGDQNPTTPDDKTEARVMALYVQDTEQKLSALEDFALRTDLFLDNINKKYRNKKISVDGKSGIRVLDDHSRDVPLECLSSGEQHELVLHYNMLFQVPENTVVLIDEPELSLHVAWQKEFLPDLLKIVEVCRFDALVATHSPYIVGDRDDLMVALSDST